MEVWREDAQPGHTHAPNEVTVQLDGAGRRLAELLDREQVAGPDTPVFVDETGRRGRTYRTIGALVGLACAGYAAVIVVTLLSGNAGAPWLPVEGHGEGGRPPARVETSQLPAEPATGASPTAGAPDASASPEDTGSATPDGSASPAPSASPDDEASGAVTTGPSSSATPRPTGGTAPAPRPSHTPEPEGPAPSVTPEPSPTGAGVTPAPSPASGGSVPLPVSESPGR